MDGHVLYAPGLGLAVASAAAIDALRAGTYGPSRADQLVRVHSGSPQVYYDLHLHRGGLPGDVLAEGLGVAHGGLRIAGGALVVRDGYDLNTPPAEWSEVDEAEARWPVPDGRYRLDLAYSLQRRRSDSDVALYLALVPAEDVAHQLDIELFLPADS